MDLNEAVDNRVKSLEKRAFDLDEEMVSKLENVMSHPATIRGLGAGTAGFLYPLLFGADPSKALLSGLLTGSLGATYPYWETSD